MRRKLAAVTFVLMGLALCTIAAYSGEQMSPVAHSSDFQKMKVLVGTWEGKSDMGKGIETLRVTYELTSSGNAILERFAAGQPHEMVTVYYDSSGKLTMTHYCSLGNQPHMELTNTGEPTMKFVLSEKNPGIASLNETHMHALTITIDGRQHLAHLVIV